MERHTFGLKGISIHSIRQRVLLKGQELILKINHMRISSRVNPILHPRIVRLPIPILPKHALSRRPLNHKLLSPHKLLLEICMAILNANRVNSSVSIDENIV